MGSEEIIKDLPEGTVTFLFTDIEGSTELLQRLKDQYATVLEEQRVILRDTFKKWRGHEVTPRETPSSCPSRVPQMR